MSKPNKHLEAFKESFNTIGLASAAALSAALLTPLPLLAGLVVEAAYLLFVPDSSWYQKRLAKRFDAEVEQRRQQLKEQTIPTLRPELQERFRRLEELRKKIDTQAQEDREWFREVVRKLDYLLEKFLFLASKERQFCDHLTALLDEVNGTQSQGATGRPRSVNRRNEQSRARRNESEEFDLPKRPLRSGEADGSSALSLDTEDTWVQQAVAQVQAHYETEKRNVASALTTEQDDSTKAILEKRTDVLQRREEFVGKIGKILVNINHQLQLVEDTFGLINDEIRARSPEQILADIEEVVVATNMMATTLEELAPFDQMMARSGLS